jgi:hypothetical protein
MKTRPPAPSGRLWTKEELANTPSRRDGYSAAKEALVRKQMWYFVQEEFYGKLKL